MEPITSSSLQSLIGFEGGTALTIYMPTHRHPAPPNLREDQIRFKNVVREAEKALKDAGASNEETKALIGHLEVRQEDLDFWRRTSRGTVFFVSKENLQAFSLPFECDERVTVGKRFDVGLAVAACSYDQPFLLLALAVHQPKLYRGDISGLEAIDIELPESPENALNIDEMFVNSNTVRGVSAGGNAIGSGRFATHGQGDSQEAGNEERLTFFRIIDHKVMESDVYDPEVPLLLAGIDSEVAEYRDVSNIRKLLAGHVDGNHTNTQPQDLHALAWPVVEEEINQGEKKALINRFNELRGADKSSTEPRSIEEAAKAGRVDTLMIGTVTSTRDTVSDDEGALMKLISPEWYEDMSINELAHTVLNNGGRVVGYEDALMPEKAPLAALYRY